MKKSTMKSLVALLNGEVVENRDELKAELEAELNRGEAKAQANRDLYAEAKDVVLSALSTTPVTVAELYEEVKNRLPAGFSKSKVGYGLRSLWADKVVKTEGKVNSYSRA